MPDTQNDAALMPMLLQRPRAFVDQILDLCALRENGSSPPELCANLKFLEMALLRPEFRIPGHYLWYALTGDGRIAEMYFQLVQSDGFFEESSAFTSTTLIGLSRLLDRYNDMFDSSSAKRFVFPRCPALFETLWKKRDLLAHIHGKQHLGTELDCNPVLRCMCAFAALHKHAYQRPAGVDTFLPHLALFIWVRLREVALPMVALEFLNSKECPCPEDDLDDLVYDVVDSIGEGPLFECFKWTLDEHCKGKVHSTAMVLGAMKSLALHERLRPLFHQHDIFHRIVGVLKHRSRSYKPGAKDSNLHSAWAEWSLSIPFFTAELNYLDDDLSRISSSGEDCLVFVACGARWIAHDCQASSYGSIKAGEYRMVQVTQLIQTHCFYDASPDPDELSAPDFSAGLLRGARAEWIPTLDALRAGGVDLEGLSEPYDKLLDEWASLGAKMGLDENRERARVLKFCSYQPCPYSRRPTGPLSTCAGCGEVQYCSRECQRGDWKVHKLLCGKRVK